MSNGTMRSIPRNANGQPVGVVPQVQAQIVITLIGGQMQMQWPSENKLLCRQLLNAARDLVEDWRPPVETIEEATPESLRLLGVG